MPFTTEQLNAAGSHAVAAFHRDARALYRRELQAQQVARKADQTASILRNQFVGFGLMVATALAAAAVVWEMASG